MKNRRHLRLVFLADLHELHRETSVPPCDIVFIAGDISMFSRSAASILDFAEWLLDQPARYRVITGGNHDAFLQPDRPASRLLQDATVLMNEATEIEGLKIWGSPVTPLSNGAFTMPSATARRGLYESIPADTDILLTHTPPFGILDGPRGSEVHEGCEELLRAVLQIQPLIHCFGHVHSGYGLLQTERTTFVNAALLGAEGDLSNRPVVLDVPVKPRRRNR